MKVRKDYDIDIGLWYLNHANSYHIVQNPSRVIPPENIFVGSGSIDDLIGEGHEWYDDIVFLMDSSETINKVRYTKECVALEEEIYRIINALRDDPLQIHKGMCRAGRRDLQNHQRSSRRSARHIGRAGRYTKIHEDA